MKVSLKSNFPALNTRNSLRNSENQNQVPNFRAKTVVKTGILLRRLEVNQARHKYSRRNDRNPSLKISSTANLLVTKIRTSLQNSEDDNSEKQNQFSQKTWWNSRLKAPIYIAPTILPAETKILFQMSYNHDTWKPFNKRAWNSILKASTAAKPLAMKTRIRLWHWANHHMPRQFNQKTCNPRLMMSIAVTRQEM